MKGALLSMTILACVCFSGCVYDAGYKAYNNMDEVGYQQQSFGDGVWAVAFVGGYPDFCKEAAFYRAAELTFEKGHRYFKIIKKEDRSTNVHSAGHTTGLGGQVAGSSVFVPVYYYKIQFLNEKSLSAKVVDAYKVLNTHNLPRKDEPYTVAQRNKDKGK